MAKIVDLSELGNIESQEQIDTLTKQCVVGEPLLDFKSLNIGTGHIERDFQAGMIHEIIESLTIHLYQLLDESEEKPENEEDIKTYCMDTISKNLRLLKVRIDDNLQPIFHLFDAYLKGNHAPEVLATAFILCSMDIDIDNQTNPIELTIDRFIEFYQIHSDVFVQALEHAWNPLLDKQLKIKLDEINDPDLKKDIETIINFRKENRKTDHFEELIH